VPIGIFLLITSFVCLPKRKPSRQEKLDLRGVGLFWSGMFLLVIPLVLGRDAGWPLWTWLCLAGCVPCSPCSPGGSGKSHSAEPSR
jgi:hypothetical protein